MYSYFPSHYPIPLTSTPGLGNYVDFSPPKANTTMVIPPYPCPMTTSAVTNTIHQESLFTSVKQTQLYKTEYCRNWSELGECRYGKKCRYAHGDGELRKVTRHSRYKTRICRTYHTEGTCHYGNRCTFIHDYHDMASAMIGGNKLLMDPLSMVDENDSGEINQKMKVGLVTDVSGNVRQHSRFFSTKNISKDHQVPLVYSPPPPPSPLTCLPEATKSPAAATVLFQNNNSVWNSKLGFGSPQPLAHTLNLVGQQEDLSTSPVLTSAPTSTTQSDDCQPPIFHTATYDSTLRPHPRSYSLPTSNTTINRHNHPPGMYLLPSDTCYNEQDHQHLNAVATLDTGATDYWATGGGHNGGRRGSYASYLSSSSSSKSTSHHII